MDPLLAIKAVWEQFIFSLSFRGRERQCRSHLRVHTASQIIQFGFFFPFDHHLHLEEFQRVYKLKHGRKISKEQVVVQIMHDIGLGYLKAEIRRTKTELKKAI